MTIIILIATKTLEKLQRAAEARDKEHQEQHYKLQGIEERLVKQINTTQHNTNQAKQNKIML